MRKHELSNAFLDGLERAIEAERFGHGDDEALRASLDALRMQYAAELRQRFPLQEEKA